MTKFNKIKKKHNRYIQTDAVKDSFGEFNQITIKLVHIDE